MDTLIEFKSKGGDWLFTAHEWIEKNTLKKSNDDIEFNRPLIKSDIEGIAAVIAYSVYKELQKPKEFIKLEPINEEHLLFKSFLKRQGISAEFSYNLKEFRQMEIPDYLKKLEKNKIDLIYCIFMAFTWNPVKFKTMVKDTMFWKYHSNQWKKKLNKFRGE